MPDRRGARQKLSSRRANTLGFVRITLRLVAAVIGGSALLPAASAEAAQLTTWTVDSRHVDVKRARLAYSAHTAGGFKRTARDALHVNVLLPDGYDGRRRFPVLYLLHPYGWSYDYWASEKGNVEPLVRDLDAVVVMPEGGRGFGTDWWNGGLRGQPGWESFLLDEVVTLAEARLALRPGRRWRAIAGFSMGGLTAVKAAARRPDYFGTVASFSGSLHIHRPEVRATVDAGEAAYAPVSGDPDPVPATSRDILGDFEAQAFYWRGNDPFSLVGNLRDTRVRVSVGDGNPYDEQDRESAAASLASGGEGPLRPLNRDFAAAARAVPLRVFEYVEHAGMHTDYMARRQLSDAIRWGLFEEPPDVRRPWAYRTVARAGRAHDMTFRFAEPPETLVSLSRGGPFVAGDDGAGAVDLLTDAGCSLTAQLPFRIRLSSVCRLRLAARPRRVRAGSRRRFRFRVTDIRGRPVPDAVVRFAGRRLRTDARGRASVRRRLRRPGRRRARPTQPDFAGVGTRLSVLRRP